MMMMMMLLLSLLLLVEVVFQPNEGLVGKAGNRVVHLCRQDSFN